MINPRPMLPLSSWTPLYDCMTLSYRQSRIGRYLSATAIAIYCLVGVVQVERFHRVCKHVFGPDKVYSLMMR